MTPLRATAVPVTPIPPRSAQSNHALADKRAQLKALREQGLLTADDYVGQQKELLDQL